MERETATAGATAGVAAGAHSSTIRRTTVPFSFGAGSTGVGACESGSGTGPGSCGACCFPSLSPPDDGCDGDGDSDGGGCGCGWLFAALSSGAGL